MRLRRSHADVYMHFVWGTWERHPLITPDLRPRLYANIAHHAHSLRADVIAIGGIEDHVHMLVRFPTTITIADFAQKVKGGSSYFVTTILRHPDPFKWQGGYGVFTLSRRAIRPIREYILDQERRHRTGRLYPALEATE